MDIMLAKANTVSAPSHQVTLLSHILTTHNILTLTYDIDSLYN